MAHVVSLIQEFGDDCDAIMWKWGYGVSEGCQMWLEREILYLVEYVLYYLCSTMVKGFHMCVRRQTQNEVEE